MEDKEIRDLEKAVEQIWEVARGFGLDPYPTNFEIVPATVMYEVGSYALPGRYSHWTFGKTYHRMKTMYDFGLSKIYEVVINTNPAYGFLLETNSPIQNKMVIAHVLGHVDFFKNNSYFSKTNRRMVESVSTHAQRMMEYEFRHGRKTVERFLDAVLAIALLVIAAYSFAWIFITIGLISNSAQAANGMATLLVIPFAFISAAYVPADSLPGWLQPVANNQPFTILSNALRSLTLGGTDAVGLGHTTTYWVALSLVWCAGIFLVFSTIAVSRFSRRR